MGVSARVRVVEVLLSVPLSALIVSVVWFGFMEAFFDMHTLYPDGVLFSQRGVASKQYSAPGEAELEERATPFSESTERRFAELLAANSTRNYLGVVLQQLQTDGNAVEIGAGAGSGVFAHVVLSAWATPKYYIVDVNSGQDVPPLLQQPQDAGRVEMLNEYGEDAPRRFPDDEFSLIFINPSSSFRGLRSDLEDWFPKLRAGGVIAGKNYCVSTNERDQNRGFDARPWCGTYQSGTRRGKEKAGFGKYTVRAVDKFAEQMTRNVHFTLEGRTPDDPFASDGLSNPSWWLMK